MLSRPKSIEKLLSRNDTGETGGHQAGILIPKKKDFLAFFPTLNENEKNPRFLITFNDEFDEKWVFSYIYYNNIFHGGTRNEYRLTGITRFINSYNIKAGDTLTLSRDENGFYYVKYAKPILQKEAGQPLKLSNNWKIVKI